jgi:CBS domain-containing protein
MSDKGVGSIVVVDVDKKPIGIITDRDIVLKVISQGKDPRFTFLKEVMSRDIIAVSEDRGFFETTRIMSETGVRRVPLVDSEGKVTGIISLDDLMLVVGEELINIARVIDYPGPVKRTREKEIR